ncbi:MAG: hypothetical protein VXV85_04165 [Candidatus Thermoplasmatota archaeon]|nr:hypothetical protein [Candidatus Thermoplasmatota archaeon]
MSILIQSRDDEHFAFSKYGGDWAGTDWYSLTILLCVLKQLPSGTLNLHTFEDFLVFTPSVSVRDIIESSTEWRIDDEASLYLHASMSNYIVAITTSENEPTWPSFDAIPYHEEKKDQLDQQWKIEVQGVSQGAYVSQAQHTIATPSRLGLKAQVDSEQLVWPPRQLNASGKRIESASEQLSETAKILTWTRLSAAGAPSEFSGRAPILDGVSTVLVQFPEGPKGVFMLADDEHKEPAIDASVRFDVRRLYGQDGMMHYGLKAILF